MPLEGAVAGMESGFQSIALSDMDQVVCVMEVDFCIESCLVRCEVCLRYFYQKPAHNGLYADGL